MASIIIIDNDRRLLKFLSRKQHRNNAHSLYIIFGKENPVVIEKLKEKGYTEAQKIAFNRQTQDTFIKEYIDLIGVLGATYKSRIWWATDISSKNRFTSRISYLLQQFLRIILSIDKKDYEEFIIINPDWVIVTALEEFVRQKAIPVCCFINPFRPHLEVIKNSFAAVLAILAQALRFYLRGWHARHMLKTLLNQKLDPQIPYYVLKTFVYDRSFTNNGNYQDAFFGKLVDFLAQRKNLIIVAYISGNYRRCINAFKDNKQVTLVPFEYFLSGADILKASFELLTHRIKLRKKILFFTHDVTSLIQNELSRTFSGISFQQYAHYYATVRLLEKIRVETFLLTYENNPWEKICIMALRQNSPDTFVIGYQHAVVPQASANMFVSRHEKGTMSQPDKILTVGDAPKKIMERYGAYRNDDIEAACGLRFEYLFKIPETSRSKTGRILVALEGIKEVYRMVSYVFKELGRVRDYQVVFRTHPVLPWHYFERTCGVSISDYPHFSVSGENSLKEDIESSDIVLYWGSTVALEALSMGKPVIHFMMDSLLSYDPLFECDNLKWAVSSQDSLLHTIKRIYQQSDQEFMVALKKAREYLASYFYPITEDKQAKFLKTRKDLHVSSTEDRQQTFAVVIPTKNRIHDLLSAVKSVLLQSRLPDELIIVDQSITDTADSAIRSLLADHREIDYKYIFNNTLTGLTAAKNLAVKISESDILLFIDDDIVLDAGFLEAIVSAYRKFPSLSGVGGIVRLPSQKSSILRRRLALLFQIGPFRDKRALLQAGYSFGSDVVPTWLLSGGLSSLRREVLTRIRFDERLHGASPIEDVDFYSQASRSFKFALARKACALHNISSVNRSGLARSYELKCLGFHYIFTKHVRKSLFTYFAFFWRNVGMGIDASVTSIQYRSLEPLSGFWKAWEKTCFSGKS